MGLGVGAALAYAHRSEASKEEAQQDQDDEDEDDEAALTPPPIVTGQMTSLIGLAGCGTRPQGRCARAVRVAEHPPRGGVVRAGEVSDAVVFLCSDAAKCITGVALPIDAGNIVK
jgi:hypothetical protein